MIKILVDGEPVPAARPRFSGGGRVYQPARNREYGEKVGWCAKSAMGGRAPLKGSLSARVKLYRRYGVTSRAYGDVDNHLKAILDGMSGIVFDDDAQIVSCSVEKHTDADNPRAEIVISEMTSDVEKS